MYPVFSARQARRVRPGKIRPLHACLSWTANPPAIFPVTADFLFEIFRPSPEFSAEHRQMLSPKPAATVPWILFSLGPYRKVSWRYREFRDPSTRSGQQFRRIRDRGSRATSLPPESLRCFLVR